MPSWAVFPLENSLENSPLRKGALRGSWCSPKCPRESSPENCKKVPERVAFLCESSSKAPPQLAHMSAHGLAHESVHERVGRIPLGLFHRFCSCPVKGCLRLRAAPQKIQESKIDPWPRHFWKISRYTSHFYRDTCAKVCPPLGRK